MAATLYNGQPGIGEAFVLQGNPAADVFVNTLANREKQRRLEELQRQKQLVENQRNISDNLAKISVPDYWVNHDKEIQDKYRSLIDYGTQLKSKNIDPNTDKDFLGMRENLFADARISKQMQEDFSKLNQEIQKNPNGYENLDEVLSFPTSSSLEEIRKTGYKPPQLRRSYTLADAIKESDGKVSYVKNNDGYTDTTKINKAGIIDQAINSTDLPSAKYLIKKSGGFEDVYTRGFPSTTKDGRRTWNTKPELVEDLAIQVLSTDTQFPEVLKSKGYDISSKENILKSATDFISKQNKAVGAYVDDYTKTLAGTGTTDYTKVFTAEANARANRADKRAASKENSETKINKYIDDLKNNTLNGSPEAIAQLNAFLQNKNAKASVKGDIIEIVVPIDEGVTKRPDGTYVGKDGMIIPGYVPQNRIIRVGKKSGESGKITLDNVFKELGLVKESFTPNSFVEDFGNSEDEVIDFGN